MKLLAYIPHIRATGVDQQKSTRKLHGEKFYAAFDKKWRLEPLK